MTLVELCEPFFQYVCTLNRSARAGSAGDLGQVRIKVKSLLFEELKTRAMADAVLAQQYEKAKLILVFFVDSLIAESDLGFAREWNENRLAYEMNELAGDEKFFDLLEETLKDTSEEATEQLRVFFTCLGLGFTGIYAGKSEELRPKMQQIAARIRHLMDVDDRERFCPEAYDNVDTRELAEPPGHKLVGLGIALIGLFIVLFIANVCLYKVTSEELRTALSKILARGGKAAETSGAPAAVKSEQE